MVAISQFLMRAVQVLKKDGPVALENIADE
jgi:hypothetical protein